MNAFRILMVCAEYAPLAKAGGLADAAAGLSQALRKRGHDVRVVLPRYGLEDEEASADARPVGANRQFFASGDLREYNCRQMRTGDADPRVYLVDCPGLLDTGFIYGSGDAELQRFMLLCRAALELCEDLDWIPDVIHCHDWHTAAVPAMLRVERARRPLFANSRTLLTIHNIGYQGVYPVTALAHQQYASIRSELVSHGDDPATVNLLENGIAQADLLNTVSPTHAREIQTAELGMGLDSLLVARAADLSGILNGVDHAAWGPETDRFLRYPYSRDDLSGKRQTRTELGARSGLADHADAVLVGLVSRLVSHKGIDLLIDALPDLLRETSLQFVLLGDGEEPFVTALRDAASKHPNRISFTQGYDDELAHLILAGSDMLLVPSRYEPCGLTQMYALRYGTVPVVRRTGGLADTIDHFNPAAGTGNGCVFEDADAGAVRWALTTAWQWHQNRGVWLRLMRNGMAEDFSWDRRVSEYEALYAQLRG